jgi:hypothetical protein
LNRLIPTTAAILILLCSAGLSASGIQPYNARYSLYKNGKLMGKTEIMQYRQGDKWVIKSESRGTHGLARLLRFRDDEHVTGVMREGRFVPEQYRHLMRVAGMDNEWVGTFNWPEKTVTVVKDGGEPLVMELTDETLDALSLKLEMRRRLADEEPMLEFDMVEEDEVERQVFRRLPDEWMETSLGCLETWPLEKVRRSQTRYTRAWHAPEFQNIEVRVEHGKVDGDHYEMRINELFLDGKAVDPLPGCVALQGKTSP